MFLQKYGKYQNFLSENFPFLVVKFSIYLNRHVFVMKRILWIKHSRYLLYLNNLELTHGAIKTPAALSDYLSGLGFC